MLSGGIGGLGKGIIDKTLAQSSGALVARLANNSAFKFGSAILGEGLEETLSTFADTYLKRFTYDPDALNATMPEYLESFILGAITSGVMKSVPALSKNTRINEEVENINNIIDAQSEAQSKGRLNDVKVLSDVVRTKAERLGKLMKETFDTTGMYIKSKLKTANKMLESKDSDIESSNQLRESISEELTQMSEEARAEAIQENGLGYMFNEDGSLSEEYKNMDEDSKRNLSKVNDTLKKLDENIKINYFKDDENNQGYYSKFNNSININLNASDPFRVVGIHEFTHSLEGTKAYKDLYDFVLNESKNNNKYDNLYQSKRRLYTKPFNDSSFVRDLKQAFNEKKITKEEYNTSYENRLTQYVNEEIVASFISEEIFTNEKTINRLTEEKPTIAKRIYNWIKNKLKKKDIFSKDFENTLNKAVNLYKKAIETANIRKMQADFVNRVKDAKKQKEINKKDEISETKHSLKEDSEGKELTKEQKEFFKDTKVLDEDGNLLRVYHGTTWNFYVFDKQKADPEGFVGSGFYFTNKELDASKNYSTEETSQDLKNKISKLAEQIEYSDEVDYEEALERAKKILVGNENNILEVYLNIKKPLYLNTQILSFEDYYENYDNYNRVDFDDDEEFEQQVYNDFYSEYEDLAYEVDKILGLDDYNYKQLSELIDYLIGNSFEGITFEDLIAYINKNYEFYSDNSFINNEVARAIVEAIGYDGIILENVENEFYNMGLEKNTNHYIVFNSNQIKLVDNLKPTSNEDIRYSIKETVEPKQYRESFDEYKENISDEKVKAFLNSELMKNEDVLKLTKAKISKKVAEFTGVENIKETTEKAKNGKLIKRTTTKLAEENHKLLVDVMKTLKSYEKNYVINAMNQVNLKEEAVKNVEKVPKQYVIDSADLNQAMVYDKKSIEKVTSTLLNKIKQNFDVELESNEQIADYIFQEINRSKKVNKKIASDIAEFIIDSAEILNKSKDSEYLKDELISEIQEELYQETLTSGREGKFHKFQRYTMDKIYDLKYKKNALSSIRKTLTSMKSYKTKSFKNAKNSEKISEILEKGMPVFEKLTEVKTEQGKDGKTTRRRYKLYNPSTRKLVLDLKSELASNKAFENEFQESLLNSVEYLRTKLNSDEKLTTYELQIVDRFFQKINSIVEEYGVNFKENKENIAIEKAKNVSEKIENKPQIKTNFAKKVTDNFLKPSDILEHIEGSVMGEESLLNEYIINPLEEADVKQGVLFQSYFKDFETFYKKNKKYLKQISKKEDFKGVKITKAQKISLYLLSKRHQARIHFMPEDNPKAHGIQIQDKNGNYVDTIFITQEDIDSIVNSFSETDLEYIKLVEDFFQTTAKEENKKADLEYQGYTLVNDDYYYPAPTAKDGDHYSRLGDARVFKKLDSVFGAYFNKEINPDANNALVLRDVNQVVVNHMNMLSKYVAYANTVKEIERFLNVKVNDERLLKTLNKKWYNFENYLNKWILDIIAVDELSTLDKFLSKVRSFLAVSQLGANVKVVVNQFSIIPTAYSVLDAKSIAKGLTMKMGKNSKALMDKYCPYVQQRNYRNEYVKGEINAVTGTLNKAQEFFMSHIGKADRQTIAMIWNACQVEVESKKGYKIGTEKNLKEAGKLLEKVVRRTQDTSTIGQPTLKRSKNALLNFLSMYQTQNLQSLSVLSRSILDLKTIKERAKTQPKNKDAIKKAQKQAYKNIARAGAGVFTSNLLYALVAVLFKRVVLDKKEDEQTFLEEFGFDILEANAGMIPILNNVYSLIFEGFDIKITALDTVNDLAHASSDLYNSIATGNYRGAWFRFSKALSPVVGIPFKNINEYGMSIISAFNPDLAYKYRSIWYNKSISEYSEDYANALQSNDTNTSEAILVQIYAEKGVSVSDNNIISKLNTIARQAGLENVKKLLPKTISDTVTYNSVEYKLTNIQERNLRSTFSKDVSSNLNKLFYNTQFNDLNAQEKAQAIKSINDYTYFNALQKVLNINTQDNKLILLSGAVNVNTLASVYAKCKNTYKGNKQAVQKYINSLKLSKEQKYILYGFLGYKPIQDNAYTLVSNYLSSKGYDYSQVQEVLTVCKFVDENGLIY